MATSLQIGIVGAGNRGINTFGKLLQERADAHVAAIADTNPERMRAAAAELGIDPRFYPDPAAMVRAEKLDGVVITTPDFLHAPHVIASLEAGARHILVDKPLATTAAGCAEVIEAMRRHDGRVTIGFNLRHNAVIRKIKEIIESGELGELMLMENREFYDGGRTYMARWNRRYELSGGLWIHKGSHDFDIFNWFNAAANPVRVSAFAGVNALRTDKIPFPVAEGKPVGPTCTACAYKGICPDYTLPVGGVKLFNDATELADGYAQDLCIYTSDKDTHDNGIALVEYDNNVRASHLECFVCNFTDRIYTIAGHLGTLTASLENLRIEVIPRWGEKRVIEVPPDAGGHGGADPHLLENFLSSIAHGTPNSSSVRDGIRAVAVGEAAERSWRGHRMVEIAELVELNRYDG